MKIKQSALKDIIKEEISLFYENHGSFAVSEMMKRDMEQMFDRLVSNIGAEKMLKELVSRLEPKYLRPVLETLMKMYNLRSEQNVATENAASGYSDEEDARLAAITPFQAKREIEKHGLEWEDFVREIGLKPSYTGEEVLDWLGY